MTRRRILVPLKRSRFEDMINLSRVLEVIFQIAIVAVALISITITRHPLDSSTLSVLVLLVVLIILYLLFRSGYYRIAGYGLILSISAIITYNLIITGGINDNAMVIFPVLITIAGLVLGKKHIPYLTVIIIAEVSGIYWLTKLGYITPYQGAITVYIQNFLTVLILLGITGVVIWISVSTLERKFEELLASESNLRRSYDQTIDAWANSLELFDEDTEGHGQRVTKWALGLAQMSGIGEEDLDHIRRGALLHDIGKMGISDQVLNKKSLLTTQERTLIERHPLHTYVLLKDISFLNEALDIPVYHHENWDGTGYPYRLAGADIPLAARIFAIADNWDALTSDRPYRKAWPEDKVVKYIENQRGKKFDPELVDSFLEYRSRER